MNDVFISYSTKDSRIAFRIYYDLQRSGLDAYLYERDGEIGVDFKEEIYGIIEMSKFFFLIDSYNSRNSQWVRKECTHAHNLIKGEKSGNLRKIIPCIVEHNDTWFRTNEHFVNQSSIRGIYLPHIDSLDHKEEYKNAITELCKECNSNFSSWSDLPRDRDFEKELATFNLSDATKRFLVSDYRNFVYSNDTNSSTALRRIQTIVDECDTLNINIISCYLALGTKLVNENKEKVAYSVYKRTSEVFPYDARSWAAFSAAQFYLGMYEDSLISIDKALKIIYANKENNYLGQHLNELLLKKIQILFELNKMEDIVEILTELSRDEINPELLVTRIKLTLIQNEFNNDNKWYIKLSGNYYDFNLNSKYLNSIIADLECRIAKYYVHTDLYEKAEHHFEIATKANPFSIQYYAELGLIKTCISSKNREELIHKGLKLVPVTDHDYYFLGLLNFLDSNLVEARICYERSNLKDWPFYNHLIT